MIFFLVALLILALVGVKYAGVNKFNTEYMSKDSTTAINGVFVILVFFSHCAQYL